MIGRGSACPRCGKPLPACICDLAPAGAGLAARHEVLILQHPQEARQPLSSTPLVPLILARAAVTVGLSWPNLRAALGQGGPKDSPALAQRWQAISPSRWGVLYLGKKGAAPAPGSPPLGFVDKKGAPIAPLPLEGLVVLDGTWSQARTMWWRNAWLLKLRRLVLTPQRTSRYGDLRLAARAEGLSTLEAVAETLRALGEDPAVPAALELVFERFLERWSAMLRGES